MSNEQAFGFRTHLIQIYSDDYEGGPRTISQKYDEGVPLMILPANAILGSINKKCWHWKVNIPSGMYTLEEYRGHNNGMMEEGPHWCYCTCKGCNRSIKVQISKNTIRFKSFFSSIPTKDKVLVAVEVGVNFKIGLSEETAEEDCVKFFYNFGPNRLEELL